MNVTITNVLHEAIMRYADDTPTWFMDKTGKKLEPQQIIAVYEYESHPYVIHVWPPRGGKTYSVEVVNMKELATNSMERLMLFGPIKNQAINALQEHLDWIESSQILNKYIAVRRGKRQLAESKYEFKNRSQAECFGINSAFDSENATILRGEEWDDIDIDVWRNRVLARGVRKNKSGLPLRIRLSGTIQWGKGPVYEYDNNAEFHTIRKFDVYDLLELGVYDEKAIAQAKRENTKDQWLRIYLLKYTDTKNFIWESTMRKCLLASAKIGWQGIPHKKGGQYRPHGMVYMGFDCGHAGSAGKKVHSVYRIDIIEIIGNRVLWLFGYEWEPVTDPTIIKMDVVEFWRFFRVNYGRGDALQHNLIADINDELFSQGLIDVDRAEFSENTPSNWNQWCLTPAWNNGKNKFLWAGITKTHMDNIEFYLPYFDKKDDTHMAKMAKRVRDALLNIRQVKNNSAYPSLEFIDDEIGDDPFDSVNMAMGCANDKNEPEPDFSQLGGLGEERVTSGMRAGVLSDLSDIGSGADYDDFM